MTAKSWRSFLSNNPTDRADLNIPAISLMWPQGVGHVTPVTMPWQRDLGLQELVNYLTIDRRYTNFIYQNLAALNTDTEVIAWRQAVLADFVNNPAMITQVGDLLAKLESLRQGTKLLGRRSRNLLVDVSDRIAELDLYTELVQQLHKILNTADLKSDALLTLKAALAHLLANERFQDLRRQLPELRAPLENIKSISIGINLDLQLRPLSAVLLSVNDQPLTERVSWMDRLIGAKTDERQESGIAQLHNLPKDPELRVFADLYKDLDNIMTQVAQPIARELNRYVRASGSTLMALEYEFAFFIAGARLFKQLEEDGIACCQPEILQGDQRETVIDGLMNLSLLLRTDKAVASDVIFDQSGRIAILTGPNSGGKTTYLQSVGLSQVMFQAGLFIPAKSARMSATDLILTHFPQLETRQQGRLAEESERLRTIFQKASAQSLVLLNETFSSTASGEAVYLAQDVLCGLRAIGVRAIYATHFVELVEYISEIENTVDGESTLCSLVAGVQLTDDSRAVPTYQISRGQPLGRSYAREIARRYGISLDQILDAHQNELKSDPDTPDKQ